MFGQAMNHRIEFLQGEWLGNELLDTVFDSPCSEVGIDKTGGYHDGNILADFSHFACDLKPCMPGIL